MMIEALTAADEHEVTTLWANAELTRPWNDPEQDFTRAIEGPTSTVLGLRDGAKLVGTVMVGHDGHRGWVYYLAVRDDRRRQGVGRTLMTAAEDWLRRSGALKVQLMVRKENQPALGFYKRIGFQESDVVVLARSLDGDHGTTHESSDYE